MGIKGAKNLNINIFSDFIKIKLTPSTKVHSLFPPPPRCKIYREENGGRDEHRYFRHFTDGVFCICISIFFILININVDKGETRKGKKIIFRLHFYSILLGNSRPVSRNTRSFCKNCNETVSY